MRFIKENDYTTLISNEIRNILAVDYSNIKLINAENMAISQIKNYLNGQYDVAAIFTGWDSENNTEDQRSHYIVMITIDCTLYHLYTNTAPDRIPEHRSTRYQDAIDWLKLVSEGKAVADLPVKNLDDPNLPTNGIRIGSRYPITTYRY